MPSKPSNASPSASETSAPSGLGFSSLRGCAKNRALSHHGVKEKYQPLYQKPVLNMAEKPGFEPGRHSTHPTPLAGEPLRPLGYFSTEPVMIVMAEREGFEPPVPFDITGFQDQRHKPLGHLSMQTSEYDYIRCGGGCQYLHPVFLQKLAIFSENGALRGEGAAPPPITRLGGGR